MSARLARSRKPLHRFGRVHSISSLPSTAAPQNLRCQSTDSLRSKTPSQYTISAVAARLEDGRTGFGMSHSDHENSAHIPLLPTARLISGRATRAWHDFIDFLDRDNVLEVAVGLILAAAFTSVVSSFVSDILTPILSLLPFINKNLDEKFAVLRSGHKGNTKYNTVTQALEDGAVVLAWGAFTGKVFNFIGFGFALYLIAQLYSHVSHDNIIRRTVRCKYCRKFIRYCTSHYCYTD